MITISVGLYSDQALARTIRVHQYEIDPVTARTHLPAERHTGFRQEFCNLVLKMIVLVNRSIVYIGKFTASLGIMQECSEQFCPIVRKRVRIEVFRTKGADYGQATTCPSHCDIQPPLTTKEIERAESCF
jgi:hypothetical protein